MDKRDRLKITIYGPYGKYEERLKNITKSLREKYRFSNTYLVKERNGFRRQDPKETDEVYSLYKSYHYLRMSNVNIFVFYCNHNESASIELTNVCAEVPKKIECCAVLKDIGCNMPSLLTGLIEEAPGLMARVMEFDGRKPNCDEVIVKLAKAKCIDFLWTKFNEI